MNQENLKQELLKLDKEQLVNDILKLAQEKLEVEQDLQIVGGVVVKTLQELGVMDENLALNFEKSDLLKSLGNFAVQATLNPGSVQKKFDFIVQAAPLLNKYSHLLKD